jgi:hypothetical protein
MDSARTREKHAYREKAGGGGLGLGGVSAYRERPPQ